MGGPLYERDMEQLALARHKEGLDLQQKHRAGRGGICVGCGRISPCDEFNAGVELVDRYARFLSAEPDPPQPPNLGRPFVVTISGGGPFPNRGPW